MTAKVSDIAAGAESRVEATEEQRNPEDHAASRGQDQGHAEPPPKHSHLFTVARWAVNISIVCLLAATMVVWLIFLAWAGRRLLALL